MIFKTALSDMDNQPIILFDGLCNLCNASVQYVIRHDPAAIFKFATLEGETGQRLLKEYGLSRPGLDSFILVQDRKAYTRSTAALRVARRLKGAVKLLYGFIIVPAFIRNGIYDLIARNRYKWFGKKDRCMIPAPGLLDRFLN
jgi:predicted DCC family thiol-disulfide oxidoreductase YuxK